MKTKLAALAFIAVLFATSCRKEKHDLEQGSYSGTYSLIRGNSGVTGNISLDVGRRKFSATVMQGDAQESYTNNGSYTTDNGLVYFEDKAQHDPGVDLNLLLSGQFARFYDGAHLVLIADRGAAGQLRVDLQRTR